jgi:hypothetical protein
VGTLSAEMRLETLRALPSILGLLDVSWSLAMSECPNDRWVCLRGLSDKANVVACLKCISRQLRQRWPGSYVYNSGAIKTLGKPLKMHLMLGKNVAVSCIIEAQATHE